MLTARLPATHFQNKAAQNTKVLPGLLRFAAHGNNAQTADEQSPNERSRLLNHEEAATSGGDEVHLSQHQSTADAETSSNRASSSEQARPELAETGEEQLKRLKDNRSWWKMIMMYGATYDYLHTATNVFDQKPWKATVFQSAIYAIPSVFAFYKRRSYGQKIKEMQRHNPSESV